MPASLDVQLRGGRPSNVLLVRRKRLLDGTAGTAVLLNNLDAAADVELGLHHGVEVVPDGLEVLGVANTLNEVVWLALFEYFNEQSAQKLGRRVQTHTSFLTTLAAWCERTRISSCALNDVEYVSVIVMIVKQKLTLDERRP